MFFVTSGYIESTTNVPSTVRVRYKMEQSSSQRTLPQNPNPKLTLENSNNHQNGNHVLQSPIISNNRLPSPGLFAKNTFKISF